MHALRPARTRLREAVTTTGVPFSSFSGNLKSSPFCRFASIRTHHVDGGARQQPLSTVFSPAGGVFIAVLMRR